MIKFVKEEKGAALALTLIVMVVLMIFGTAFLNFSLADSKFARINEDKIQAHYLARSGAQTIAEYMISDPGNALDLIGKTSQSNTQVAGGEIVVSVYNQSEGSPAVIRTYVEAKGVFRNVEQSVKVRLNRTLTSSNFLTENAIVAPNLISHQGNGNTIDISGSVLSTSVDNIFPSSNSGATITGGEKENSNLPQMLAAVVLNYPDSYDATYNNLSGTNTLNTSNKANYYVKVNGDMTLSGNQTLTIKSPGMTHIYLNGDLDFGGNSELVIEPGAKLAVYKTNAGSITISGDSKLLNNMFIFAPESTVTFNNNNAYRPDGGFYGVIVGKIVSLPNKIDIVHVDFGTSLMLDTSNVGITFNGYTWVNP